MVTKEKKQRYNAYSTSNNNYYLTVTSRNNNIRNNWKQCN